MRPISVVTCVAFLVGSAGLGLAQSTGAAGVPRFSFANDGPMIRRHVMAGQPFTVAGPRGVVLGQQEGTFEAWVLPVKVLSHFAIRAEVAGYTVPIDLNAEAAEIEVRPERTTITYAHIAFTVRQTMFAPEDGAPVVLFEIDSTRGLNLTFSFTPEMRPMWPERGYGGASAEWDAGHGMYLLHTDFPGFAGAVTIPGALPGVLAPYQEKPQVHPLELRLQFDPKRDAGRVFPLLMAVGTTPEAATNEALEGKIARLQEGLAGTYAGHVAAYAAMRRDLTSVVTPDAGFNEDFAWAEVSIEQLRAQVGGETGLVAGYYSSGDSARPGFGWFFGRDSLYTLYAVNGMGDFGLARQELEFLMKRQRADGKVMHEYSQTAAEVDWKSFPYEYAAADATPLFLTAMLDYVVASGDVGFLKAHEDKVRAAWGFEMTHDADGDGIYDNSQGTGWVEDWRGGKLPKQEIYLALLDQQASVAMGRLAELLGDAAGAKVAGDRGAMLAGKIETEYFQAGSRDYAFSHNADGSVDAARTLYPAIAWWNGGAGLKETGASFRAWDSHRFSTDWGTRDVAEDDPVYDPISYHMGSVWPLFTGWEAVADYRTGRTLAGYQHLMQNMDLTTAQDLGAVTELLSGAYFVPFGRSTSHQLWSSAMVITPALRGLFGITVDGLGRTVTVEPRLPADWETAEVRRLHVGASVCSLKFVRVDGEMRVTLTMDSGPLVKLVGAKTALPAVEAAVGHGLPPQGSRTMQMKVLDQRVDGRTLTLEVEGWAGTSAELGVRINRPGLKVAATGATLGGMRGDGLLGAKVTFDGGNGYQTRKVLLQW